MDIPWSAPIVRRNARGESQCAWHCLPPHLLSPTDDPLVRQGHACHVRLVLKQRICQGSTAFAPSPWRPSSPTTWVRRGCRAACLGVGVFFTLSGFLITTILLSTWDRAGNLDLKHFWLRRARRLLPAVVLVLLVVLVATAIVDPAALAARASEALAALFYVANWTTIAAGVSYFDRFAGPGPLDHLWSLAVEEQFYLLWPLLLLGLLKRLPGQARPGRAGHARPGGGVVRPDVVAGRARLRQHPRVRGDRHPRRRPADRRGDGDALAARSTGQEDPAERPADRQRGRRRRRSR